MSKCLWSGWKYTVWKVSKYGVSSNPYFRVFGPEKNSVFGDFSRSGGNEKLKKCPPPSPAVLWFVNVREGILGQKKNELSWASLASHYIWS